MFNISTLLHCMLHLLSHYNSYLIFKYYYLKDNEINENLKNIEKSEKIKKLKKSKKRKKEKAKK